MRIGRLAWLFFKVGSLNELQYRANFFIQLLQSAVSVGVALVVLALVYSQTTELNGWSESELMIVLGIQILLGGVIRTTIQPNMQRLMEDVRDGKLDFALTKPEDSQVLVSIRNVQIWRAVDVIAGAAVLAYGIDGLDAGVGVGDVLLFLGLLLLGAVTIYCFWLVIATLAFWIVNVWEIIELFDGIYQAGRWPTSIFPGWLRFGVTFIFPLAFAITVPAEAITSRLEWSTVGIAIGFAVGALRLHALVVGLRPAPLLGRLGLRLRRAPTRAGAPAAPTAQSSSRRRRRRAAARDEQRQQLPFLDAAPDRDWSCAPARRAGTSPAEDLAGVDDPARLLVLRDEAGRTGRERAGSNVATSVSASRLMSYCQIASEIRLVARDPPAASRCRARRR